jgi:hypothetical protein
MNTKELVARCFELWPDAVLVVLRSGDDYVVSMSERVRSSSEDIIAEYYGPDVDESLRELIETEQVMGMSTGEEDVSSTTTE